MFTYRLIVILAITACAALSLHAQRQGGTILYRDMTPEDVSQVLGAPTSIAQRGDTLFYIFNGGLRVEFQNGYVYSARGASVRTRFDEQGRPILPSEQQPRLVATEVVAEGMAPTNPLDLRLIEMTMPSYPEEYFPPRTGRAENTTSQPEITTSEEDNQAKITARFVWYAILIVTGVGGFLLGKLIRTMRQN